MADVSFADVCAGLAFAEPAFADLALVDLAALDRTRSNVACPRFAFRREGLAFDDVRVGLDLANSVSISPIG